MDTYALLADGTTVQIRPATPGGFDAVLAMNEAMSPDSIYLRSSASAACRPSTQRDLAWRTSQVWSRCSALEMRQFTAAARSRAAPSKARDLHACQYDHGQGRAPEPSGSASNLPRRGRSARRFPRPARCGQRRTSSRPGFCQGGMVWFLSWLEGVVRVDLYSVVCVRDRATSHKWFEALFGRPADHVIGEEYLWQVGENAWVVIDDRYMRAERVGGTMITLGVTDLDDILARLAANGIGHEPVETYGSGVRHVEVLDPDGNSLSLAETPAR